MMIKIPLVRKLKKNEKDKKENRKIQIFKVKKNKQIDTKNKFKKAEIDNASKAECVTAKAVTPNSNLSYHLDKIMIKTRKNQVKK